MKVETNATQSALNSRPQSNKLFIDSDTVVGVILPSIDGNVNEIVVWFTSNKQKYGDLTSITYPIRYLSSEEHITLRN